MKRTIQITLSVDDWNEILWWCETHKDRSNMYEDDWGNPDPEQIKEFNEWTAEYRQTEKVIDRLYKKIHKRNRQ